MKNKLSNKLLALILSISLLFSLVPSTPVFAENEVYGILVNYNTNIYNCDSKGENIGTTSLQFQDVTHLFIASDVEKISRAEYTGRFTNLVSLTIPPTVRVISDTFGGSPKLENIDFSNATGLEEIKGTAFMVCPSLKTIDLSKATSLKAFKNSGVSPDSAFGNCINLKTVLLPKNLKELGGSTFYGCPKLADVTFLSKTPPTTGEDTFRNAKDQIRFHLPTGSNVNEWEAALLGSGATNPILIADNKYGIYKGDGNVYECDENAVPTATVADKKTITHLFIAEDVTAIKSKAFSECGNLVEVNFSNAANLTSIGDYAFAGCESLETIKIPDTVTSIGEFAFANCKSLLSMNFPTLQPPTLGMNSFANTKDGINVTLKNGVDENDWRQKLLAAGMTNPNFVIDRTPPTAQITVGDAIFTTATDPVTFDTLLKDKVEITITASDTDSAIKTIEYQEVSSEADYNVDGIWKPYTDKFDVNYLGKNIIYVRATDLAGNQTIINTNGFIVYADSQLRTEVTEFDRKEENQKDIFVMANLNGNTLKNITNGGTVLKSGTDYIIEEISPARSSASFPEGSLILYIQKSYLAKLPSGIQTLNFNFNPYGVEGGLVINTPLEITIKDTGHVHDFATEFTIDRNSTCTEKGEKSKHCKDFALCGGKTDITEVELVPHEFFDVRHFDENEHWNNCINCTGKVDVEKHNWTTSKNQPGGENIWGMDYILFADMVVTGHSETPTMLDYRCTGCKATKREEYKLTEKIHDMTTGDNLVHAIGTKEGITFASVANINEYLGTTIDKIPLKQDDIKVKAGSTIVTIGSAYLDTLPNGKHTVSIYSTTGTATANFTVVGNKETPTTPEKPTNPVTPTKPVTPNTGDNDNMSLWISLLFVSGGALTIFGISKKRRKVNGK